MIVRAPATPIVRENSRFRDCVLRYDALVYRFGGVVDLGRTTQFLEPHTAGGGFESIKRPPCHASKMMSRGSSVLLEKQLTAVCGRVVCVWCSLPHTRAPHTTKQQAAAALHTQKHCKQKEKVIMT